MAKKIKIGQIVLQEMSSFLQNEKIIGCVAPPGDMYFIRDGAWLKDSAVIEAINNRQGTWDVLLIFAHYKNPLLLIVRKITSCFSLQRATAAAFYIKKEAAKDRRGTLAVSIDDLNLCYN